MATQIFANGSVQKIPGVYSTIKSGIKNPSIALAFGNCLIIDTGSSIGSGGFFGGKSGINGTISNGKDAIYTFDNSRDFRNFIRGGLWWKLAESIFTPGGGATNGASSITFVSAKTSTPAEISLEFGDFASTPSNDGSIIVQVRDEGYVGNAVLGDEVRAKATITVTNAGSNGNTFSILVQGETVATYTVQTGNTIPQIVTALAASATSIGLVDVFSTSNTQLVIQAPRGKADTINTVSPTIVVTGTTNGSAAAFSGGVEGTILTRGYAAKLAAGIVDTSKFILKFYRGTFKGLDTAISSGSPWDNIAELSSRAELIAQSPEISTVQELVTWMEDESGKGYLFNQYFKLLSYDLATGTDEIEVDDITGLYVKATGGTESFSIDDLNDVLENLEGNYDFILADKFGSNALATSNLAILDWIQNTAKIKPDLYVAAGDVIGEFTFSNTVAQTYDSEYVTVVHGGAKKVDIGGRTMKEYDSILKAAYLMGREAGLEPQTPLTFKGIGISGELHQLKDKEVNQGLDSGLLMTRLDSGSFECIKGVNSLQNNDFLVNSDGSTHSKQIARIKRQINKELLVGIKQSLLKKPNGANRNTVGPDDVKSWVEAYLNTKVATDTQDNLLISFSNVTASLSQDVIEVTYLIVPNTEISFVVAVGFIVEG